MDITSDDPANCPRSTRRAPRPSTASASAASRRRRRRPPKAATLVAAGRRWMVTSDSEGWPSIPVVGWQDTRDTLQLYTQVVGKVRLANEPPSNHWWNVPLYV